MKSTIKGFMLLTGLLIASQNVIGQQQNQVKFSLNDLSQEELQQLKQEMMARRIVDSVLLDLIKNNKESIDWLLLNFVNESEKAMEKIMRISQDYLPNKGKAILYTLATEFGIKNKKDSDDFVMNSMEWLSQIVPAEFAKWIYYSAQAGLVRRK